jgi:hypothetical protein
VLAAITDRSSPSSASGNRATPDAESLDMIGILTLSLSVFCLAFYITQGPALGFGSPVALGIIGHGGGELHRFHASPRRSAPGR